MVFNPKGAPNPYSPYPPPLPLPFPWIGCQHCDDWSILFYLPDKQKSYNIPFLRNCKKVGRIDYGHGCLLLLFDGDVFDPPLVHIFNPITGVQIKLPPCSLSRSTFRNAHISSPPTDPNCTLLVVNYDHEAYFYGLNNNCGWRKVEYFYGLNNNNNDNNCVEQMIKMDLSDIRAVDLPAFEWSADFVDFFGELVMIAIVYDDDNDLGDYIKEFHVYRADISTNKWARMDTLGDGVLFYSSTNTFALRAVDVGCKKNTIYSVEGSVRRVAWRAFDLSARDWIDGPPLSLSNVEHRSAGFPVIRWSWFLPTLDYFSGAKTNGPCQNICLDA